MPFNTPLSVISHNVARFGLHGRTCGAVVLQYTKSCNRQSYLMRTGTKIETHFNTKKCIKHIPKIRIVEYKNCP
jgi:hypothetical protein